MFSVNAGKCRVLAYFEMLKRTFTFNYLAFLLMRITGIALVLYLILHIWSIGHVRHGSVAFNDAMAVYNKPLFWLFEYLLLLAVLYHMFNGLRLIIADFFSLTEHQSFLLWLAGLCVVIIGAFSISVFLPGIIPL
jgi:succinate dehydrogenase / fumarate reductase, cytochrome b subunit